MCTHASSSIVDGNLTPFLKIKLKGSWILKKCAKIEIEEFKN